MRRNLLNEDRDDTEKKAEPPRNQQNREPNFVERKFHGESLKVRTPEECNLHNVESKKLKTPDGDLAYWYTPAVGTNPTIVYFQGRNRGLGHSSIVDRWVLLSKIGYGIACFDPRNYGESFRGNVLNVLDDDREFMNFLLQQKNIPKEKLYCMGNSRGSGHAAMMAQEYDCAGLILQAAYSDPLELNALTRQAKNYVICPINTIKAVAEYHNSVLILHGLRDQIISFKHAQELAEAASDKAAVRIIVYEDCGHLDMPKEMVISNVDDFINNPPLQVGEIQSFALSNSEIKPYLYNPLASANANISNIVNPDIKACLSELENKRAAFVNSSRSNFKRRNLSIFYNNLSSDSQNDKLSRAALINKLLEGIIPLIEMAEKDKSIELWDRVMGKLTELLSEHHDLIYRTRTVVSPGISKTGDLFNMLAKQVIIEYEKAAVSKNVEKSNFSLDYAELQVALKGSANKFTFGKK